MEPSKSKPADLLTRPIIGGVFGAGRYALATVPCVVRGLHGVRFMVIEPLTGAVLSLADDKLSAIEDARTTIRENERLALERSLAGGRDPRQSELWPRVEPRQRPVVDRRRPVSKRRRDIFAKSGGCCHYCERPLQLDGIWHVEHMLPRALGGDDDIHNLVAACAPCNLAKRDQTAIEYIVASTTSRSDIDASTRPTRGGSSSPGGNHD